MSKGIVQAGTHDEEHQTGRMLGHLFVDAFADPFGGSVLGGPYCWALNLPAEGTPRHFQFDFADQMPRMEFIETPYASINEAPVDLSDADMNMNTQETLDAFPWNVEFYSEDAKLLNRCYQRRLECHYRYYYR